MGATDSRVVARAITRPLQRLDGVSPGDTRAGLPAAAGGAQTRPEQRSEVGALAIEDLPLRFRLDPPIPNVPRPGDPLKPRGPGGEEPPPTAFNVGQQSTQSAEICADLRPIPLASTAGATLKSGMAYGERWCALRGLGAPAGLAHQWSRTTSGRKMLLSISGVKVAVTLVWSWMVRVTGFSVLSTSPLQPTKVQSGAGSAVRVTSVPCS